MQSAARASDTRRCPFCSAIFQLGACHIVATNFPSAAFLYTGGMEGAEISLPSRTTPIARTSSGWPVLAYGQSTEVQQGRQPRSYVEHALASARGRSAGMSPLRPLHDGSFSEVDRPARACPECGFPLPREIDTRNVIVVAVVGVNRAGKTNFLSACLTEAYQRNGLAALRCTEFVPQELTATRFMNDYFIPLFRDRVVLEKTPEAAHVRFMPLLFNVTLSDRAPFILAIHDVAGESLADPMQRAVTGAFLRATRAMLFILDPREIESLRADISSDVLDQDAAGFDQSALLGACLASDGMAEANRHIPVAVVIAKSDLLNGGLRLDVATEADAVAQLDFDAFRQRVIDSSESVRAGLAAAGAYNILSVAQAYNARARERRAGSGHAAGVLTFHSVSALGGTPLPDGSLPAGARPLNCVEPLGAVLSQVAQLA